MAAAEVDLKLDMPWQNQNIVKVNGAWTVDGRAVPSVFLVAKHSPANIPDHYYIGLKVIAPPRSATPPHTHGGGAVAATILKGRMINQMVCPHHEADSQGTGVDVVGVGESWYEPPGCHHVRSENPFEEEAEFMTWFVISKKYFNEKGVEGLVVIDAAVHESHGTL